MIETIFELYFVFVICCIIFRSLFLLCTCTVLRKICLRHDSVFYIYFHSVLAEFSFSTNARSHTRRCGEVSRKTDGNILSMSFRLMPSYDIFSHAFIISSSKKYCTFCSKGLVIFQSLLKEMASDGKSLNIIRLVSSKIPC